MPRKTHWTVRPIFKLIESSFSLCDVQKARPKANAEADRSSKNFLEKRVEKLSAASKKAYENSELTGKKIAAGERERGSGFLQEQDGVWIADEAKAH